jgi:phage terminase small subunit
MNPRQRRFVQEYAIDGNAAAAARRAGYSAHSARVNGPRMLRNAAIREALQASQRDAARRSDLDRQDALDGLREAIQAARAKADPHAMIAGWREVARMCGFYQPEVQRVEVSSVSKRVIGQLEAMSDDELLALAEAALPRRP